MPTGVFERTERHRESYRKATIKQWKDPEVRKRMIKALSIAQTEAQNRPEVKKKHKDATRRVTTKLWQDPEYRKKQIEAQRRLMIDRWQDPEYVRAKMKANHIKPNKAELKLGEILQQILPSEYKFVGDGEFILAGKCPDFVNVNGQKKIIELYGNYWHRGETGKGRKALFKQYGYETLIVWENELEGENALKEKLLNFNEVREWAK